MKVAQSCLILCDPMDYTAHGILQARILVGVAFPFSRDLPNPGTEPRSPALQILYQLSHRGNPEDGGTPSYLCMYAFSDYFRDP